MIDQEIYAWLMAGDPSIRWQVMQDLLDEPAQAVCAEQKKVSTQGWGRRLLDLQGDNGRWPANHGPHKYQGLYMPKWTSTTYTLLLLRRLGLEPGHPRALDGCQALIEGAQWFGDGGIGPWSSPRSDMCVNAMTLGIFEWFDLGENRRQEGLVQHLLDHQLPDGGWNCRRSSQVSSVHTTISALEALQLRRANKPSDRVDAAMARAQEYLLTRSLFRSRRTGRTIHPSFKMLSFPPRWKYDILRALDHLQDAGTPPDKRAADAIHILQEKQRKDGRWPVQRRHPGAEHFLMEKTGGPSRWNTLRALRVLKWWGGG